MLQQSISKHFCEVRITDISMELIFESTHALCKFNVQETCSSVPVGIITVGHRTLLVVCADGIY